MLCIHSDHEIEVTVEDTLKTDIEDRTNLLLIKKFGQTYKKTIDYVLKYSLSDKIMAYSYAVENISTQSLKVSLDSQHCKGFLHSIPESSLTKVIRPNATEFFYHGIINPNSTSYKRDYRCKPEELDYFHHDV